MDVQKMIDMVDWHIRFYKKADDNRMRDDLDGFETIKELLKKQETYEPEIENVGSLQARKCKCGAYYIDDHFDGYCSRCGQKVRW